MAWIRASRLNQPVFNAFSEDQPIGPTISAPSPAAISSASVFRATSLATTSRAKWMFGCPALKSLTTCLSTVICFGSLPTPSPTNQRISTVPSASGGRVAVGVSVIVAVGGGGPGGAVGAVSVAAGGARRGGGPQAAVGDGPPPRAP